MSPGAFLRRRGQALTIAAGAVIGMLLVAIVIPKAAGKPLHTRSQQVAATSGGAGPGQTAPGQAASTAGEQQTGGAAAISGGAAGGATTSGGTSSGSGGQAASTVTTSSPGGPVSGLQPTDRGVTATSVKIGFLILDVGSVAKFGVSVPGVDPQQQEDAYTAFVKDVNDHGGINGRTIQPVFHTFDVLSQDDMRAACLALTQDEKVFAVVGTGGFFGPPVLCVTEENSTPMILEGSQATPAEYYQRSGGRLFTVFPNATRQMGDWASELDSLGVLKGKKIGILSDQLSDPGDLMVGGALVPALSRLGYSVTYRSVLSADLGTGASQVPVEVSQMHTKGVDMVFLATSTAYATQFVETADGQQWTPRWSVSDFGAMQGDTSSQNMPASYQGTVSITATRTGEWRANIPEPAADAACRTIYEQATGKTMPRNNGTSTNGQYIITVENCGMTQILAAAARAAGPNLTRAAFVAAFPGVGAINTPYFMGGAFGQNKPDYADVVRTASWYADCKCWKPVDQPRRGRF